jgi:hypothetical protein
VKPSAAQMRRCGPKAPQKACDIGLFSDDDAQTDMVDLARKVDPR